jgi:hypothetical protein
MAHTHTIKITTEQPVDAKQIEQFLDACGYLMTGFLGADAQIHATWNEDGSPVTAEQVKRFGPMESVGTVSDSVTNDREVELENALEDLLG